MPASLREQILLRVAAILTPANVGAQSVSRSREISISRAISPAVVIMPAATDNSKRGDRHLLHHFEFKAEIFVRGDTWDSLADPIDVAVHSRLLADFADKQTAGALGSLLADIDRIAEEFEAQEADRTAGTLTVRYRAVFLTSKSAIDRTV